MNRRIAVLLVALLVPLAVLACERPKPRDDVPKQGAVYNVDGGLQDRYFYATGTAGTYTVPNGYYVTSWWAHNTSGGGTVKVTPSGPRNYGTCAAFEAGVWDAGPDPYDAAADTGPDTYDGAAPPWFGDAGTCQATGPAIAIPAATGYQQTIEYAFQGPDTLGDGTIFVFTSTDSYIVTMLRYGP